MSNIERQENNTAGVVLFEPVYQQSTLNAVGAIILASGTVLGRITASGKFKEYDSGAVDGSEVPVAILQNGVEFTGAGDVAINAIIGGQVRLSQISVYNGGAPIAPTIAEIDALRDFTILARATSELSQFDN